MKLTEELKEFIRIHENEDTDRLLLNSNKYAAIDIPFVVNQIKARKRIKDKLPLWYENRDIIYPSILSTEQCSSEKTAEYKSTLISGGDLCDLTGGLGVDSFYFSRKADKVFYIEINDLYCEAAINNFHALKVDNIEVLNADVSAMSDLPKVATFYIDPARRTSDNARLYSFKDCEPDILSLKDRLSMYSSKLIIKASPMVDITECVRQLKEVSEIHVVSVKNECKEILFVLDNLSNNENVLIRTINFVGNKKQLFDFKREEEKDISINYADSLKIYLYEPNSSILKAGAFNIVSSFFSISKLSKHSHLYTSDILISEFPGRIFRVKALYPYSRKFIKKLSKSIPKANITTRNFNLSVQELRKISGIKEGGDIYLFATILNDGSYVLIESEKS